MKAKRFLLFILASLCLFTAFGMKSSILSKIKTLKDKYAGYVSLFEYNLANLCVKAEAAAFLPVKVFTDTGLEPFEDVAMIAMDPQDKYDIIAADEFSEKLEIYEVKRQEKDLDMSILRAKADFFLQIAEDYKHYDIH